MTQPRRAAFTVVAALAVGLTSGAAMEAQQESDDDKKPSLALRATPPVGFSPLRVRVVVDVRGGDEHYADFYCPSIEWDWDDGTTSESSEDCEPYQPGKSTISRRFTSEHTYRQSDNYRVVFRLKQKDRTVGSASATVQVRPGAGEDFDR